MTAPDDDVPNADPSNGGDNAAPPQPMLAIRAQYVKDLSFEAPTAPAIFTRLTEAPEVDFNVEVDAQSLGDQVFEVTLRFEVKARTKTETAFIFELVYGAVAEVRPLDPSHLEPLLRVELPHLMFPFCRALVADTIREGGFPPLLIQPIDFAGLFQRQLQKASVPVQ